MRRWGSAYLGRSTFPKDVSEFELDQAFRFNARERRDIRKAFRVRHRLAAALQFGFLRLTGTALASVGYVPKIVLHMLGRQFRVPAPDLATIRALYRRRSTRFEHRSWAVANSGLMRMDARGQQGLEAALRDRTHATLSRPRLEQFAREWLYSRYYLIPGRRRVTLMVRRVVRTVEDRDHEELCQCVAAARIETLLAQLLASRSGHAMTALEWLRRAPRRRSLKTLRELYRKYAWLEYRVKPLNLAGIPRERQRVYARRFRRRRTADLDKLRPQRRDLEAVCFCMVTLATLADDLLRLIEIRIAAIWRWAYAVAIAQGVPERTRKRREILAEIGRLAGDATVSDAAFRLEVLSLLDPAGATAPTSRAADVREVLSRNARRVRPVVELLLKLDLQKDGFHPAWTALDWLRDIYQDKLDHLWPEPPTDLMGRWEPLIRGNDGRRGLRAFEAATLWSVRRALRNGSLWSRYGDEFSQPLRNIMPADEWRAQAHTYRFRMNIPSTPEAYTDMVQATLGAALAGLQEAVAKDTVIIAYKDLYFPPDEAESIPHGIELAQHRLYRQVGRVQFPVLLLELDAQVHFSWKLLGREPKSAEELLAVYAAILAAGTDLESRGISTMIRGVRESAVRRYMRLIESEPGVRAANEAIVTFARRHPIVEYWGTGYEASSDLMSLDASKQLWNARVDPKRRTYGVGIYTTVLDQWGIPYDQPLPLLTRQAGAAIEGVVRQRVTPISRLAVDTHGYTDIALGMAKLLGFDLCPRMHDMREQWLHVPRGWPEIPELEPILKRDINLEDIHAEHDNLVRFAASVDQGYTSATYLFERLGAAARSTRLHRAGTQLGQLWRTVYLCDYTAQPAFRRTINRLLVRGESVHQLQRAIHYGPIRAHRGRRREELTLISGALTLLTNAVIAYNTWKLNDALDARQRAGRRRPDDDILAHIAPIAFGHINFRGVFRFPLERYVDRLVPSAQGLQKAVNE
jgi:TnpA family transposase